MHLFQQMSIGPANVLAFFEGSVDISVTQILGNFMSGGTWLLQLLESWETAVKFLTYSESQL